MNKSPTESVVVGKARNDPPIGIYAVDTQLSYENPVRDRHARTKTDPYSSDPGCWTGDQDAR